MGKQYGTLTYNVLPDQMGRNDHRCHPSATRRWEGEGPRKAAVRGNRRVTQSAWSTPISGKLDGLRVGS